MFPPLNSFVKRLLYLILYVNKFHHTTPIRFEHLINGLIFKNVEDESLDTIGRIKKTWTEGWSSLYSIIRNRPIEFKVDTKEIDQIDIDKIDDIFNRINAGEDLSTEISKLSSSVRNYVAEADKGTLSTDDLKAKLKQASI